MVRNIATIISVVLIVMICDTLLASTRVTFARRYIFRSNPWGATKLPADDVDQYKFMSCSATLHCSECGENMTINVVTDASPSYSDRTFETWKWATLLRATSTSGVIHEGSCEFTHFSETVHPQYGSMYTVTWQGWVDMVCQNSNPSYPCTCDVCCRCKCTCDGTWTRTCDTTDGVDGCTCHATGCTCDACCSDQCTCGKWSGYPCDRSTTSYGCSCHSDDNECECGACCSDKCTCGKWIGPTCDHSTTKYGCDCHENDDDDPTDPTGGTGACCEHHKAKFVAPPNMKMFEAPSGFNMGDTSYHMSMPPPFEPGEPTPLPDLPETPEFEAIESPGLPQGRLPRLWEPPKVTKNSWEWLERIEGQLPSVNTDKMYDKLKDKLKGKIPIEWFDQLTGNGTFINEPLKWKVTPNIFGQVYGPYAFEVDLDKWANNPITKIIRKLLLFMIFVYFVLLVLGLFFGS